MKISRKIKDQDVAIKEDHKQRIPYLIIGYQIGQHMSITSSEQQQCFVTPPI